jgi:ComF family protein
VHVAVDEPSGIRKAVALWEFEESAPVRDVLHRLKYGNAPWIGLRLGRLVATARLPPLDAPWDLVVPVPLHRRRLLERGYNQSEWIGRGFSSELSLGLASSTLIRLRHTRTQTSLERERRRQNVEGAFAVNTSMSVVDQRILLIDDTLTTGSTLGSAARALIDEGAACVQPVAVARAALRMEQEQASAGSVISGHQFALSNESSFLGNNL